MNTKFFSLLLLLLCCVCVCAEPMVKIPRITAEKANELASAEYFLPEYWNGAAVITTFSSCTGMGKIAVPTAFYLFHDGENLWAAAYCYENDFPNAMAFDRESHDDLTLDESVQIVFGLDGKFGTKFTMGGYDGAYAELGKCAHTYEMTVNFAGASNRRYDETPLENSKFDYTVVPAENGWAVLFSIPFSTVGYDWRSNPLTYFNLFRFYRGERYGWHLPSFGGYSQLPMAKAEFLDFEQNSEATVEELTEYTAPAAANTAIPQIGRADIEYYPATAEIAAEFKSGWQGADIVLTVNGKNVSDKGSRYWPTRLVIPVDSPAGTKLSAVLTCNGQVVQRKEFAAKAPATWKTGTAIEYLDDKVPYPWSSPVFENGILKLEHMTIDYGSGMLPQAVENCRGLEVLAGPVTLEFEKDGEILPVNDRADCSNTVTAVDMFSAAEAGVEVKTHTEYDGFMTVRARITGGYDTVPDTLRLRIPLAEGMAQYLTTGSAQSLVKIGGCGYRGNMRDDFWVGNRDGGVIFTFGHYLFYSAPNGRQLEINGDEIVVTIVSEDGVRPPPDNVYEFHLQFTPFRNDYIPPLKADLWFEGWSDYQSYPDTKKIPEIKQRANNAKAQGKDLYIYFGQVMAENAPEFAEYPANFTAYPRRPWYQRGYDPGKGVPCSVICFREEVGEFMLGKIEQIVEESGLGGVYLDGPSVPFWCLNMNHPCSIFLPAQWDGSWHDGAVAGQRSYMKRLRGIFDSRGIRNPIWHHTGGGFSLVHFSHCDFFLEGEQLSRYRSGYLLPPDVASVVYSGYPFGYQGILWFQAFADGTFSNPFRRAEAWSLPHGIVTACALGPNWNKFLDITRRNPDARFYAYTAEQPHIKHKKENTLCTSYYLAEKEAILISGNLVYDGVQEAQMDISGMFPGEELQVRCLTRDETPDFRDGILKYSMDTKEMHVYWIAPVSTDASALDLPDPVRMKADVPAPVPLTAKSDFDPADWKIEAGRFAPVAGSGLEYGLTTEEKRAFIAYNGTLPDNINIRMQFRHNNNFKFYIDGVELSNGFHRTSANIYHWGGWVIEKLNQYDLLDTCEVSPGAFGRNYIVTDRPVNVDIYIAGGRVSMYYDGVCVIRNAQPETDHSNGHTFALELKDDDSWVAFDIEYIGPCAKDDLPVWQHPIL